MIEKNIQEQLRAKYNPEGSDLRRAQMRMLDLLKFLDKICKENNLTYWIDSGTLLGAVRHGGFIPWDDDVDVCMPRKDALKLKKIMGNSIYENHIILQNQSTDWNYINCSWMTIRDLNSEYISENNIHNAFKYRGLQIDIFEVESGVRKWMKSIITKYFIFTLALPALKAKSIFIKNVVNVNARILNRVIVPFCRLFKSHNTTITYAIGIPSNQTFSKDIVYPLNEISFENNFFKCPNDVDGYLNELYGNWEKIPTHDEIQTHNVSFKFK